MQIQSKVNGLIIGGTQTTSDVVKLGRGKYADFKNTSTKAKPKRRVAPKKTTTTTKTPATDSVEKL